MTNFRKYTLKTGRTILAGRDSQNNDELVKSANPKDILLHTEKPGSPFTNLGERPTKEEISEAAIFTAKYSQDWRDHKGDVLVNKFLKKDTKKSLFMKSGTWSVKTSESLKVKKMEILKLEKRLNENADKKRIPRE